MWALQIIIKRVNLILEHKPDLVFLEIDPSVKKKSLVPTSELQVLIVVPKS
jgi:hypothetical protein